MKIAVVGLGVAGLSISARLALAGHDVSGFEQFELTHERGSSHGDTRIMRLTPGEGEVYARLARRAQPIWRTWEGLAGRPLIEWTGGVIARPDASAPGTVHVPSPLSVPAESTAPMGTPATTTWDNTSELSKSASVA